MAKKIKKLILPGATMAISLYFSIFFTVGIIAGYLGTNLFHKKLMETGKVKSVILPFRNWEIHMHHWILGGLVAFIAYVTNIIPSLPIFYIGALGGVIFHDFYSDKEWYRVIYRKKP